MPINSTQSVLIVEDEMLIAMNLETSLDELGLSQLAIATSVDDALEFLEREKPCCAFLDVSIGSRKVDPIVEKLAVQNIPFVFCTADQGTIAAKWRDRPMIEKPVNEAQVADALRKIGLLTVE